MFYLPVGKSKGEKKQEILFLLKIGGETDNTRTELVTKSCQLYSLHNCNSDRGRSLLLLPLNYNLTIIIVRILKKEYII